MDKLMKFLALSGAGAAPSSMTSQLDNMSFRPNNLPKKNAEEEQKHRRLVEENRREYLKKLKRRENELKEKKRKEEERERHLSELQTTWEKEILPSWNVVRKESRVAALWREGIPPAVRGKVWMLAIGNKTCITPELFNICTQKARKIRDLLNKVISLDSSNTPPEKQAEAAAELAKLKKELAQYEQPESKERSISGIQVDLPRTFPELGFFKRGGGFYEDLEQVLEVFVVCRPDIGYVI